MGSQFRILGLILLVSQLLTSCAFLKELISGGIVAPKVTLENIDVKVLNLAQIQLDISLNVSNPNDFDLDFQKLKYVLHTQGDEIANGLYEQPINIKANAGAKINLPLKVNIQKLLGLFKKFIEKKEKIIVNMDATADFKSPVGVVSLDFQEKKAIN